MNNPTVPDLGPDTPVDLVRLRQFAPDADSLAAAIEKFRIRLSAGLRRLGSLRAAGDHSALRVCAHQLAGTCGVIGALGLVQRLRDIESLSDREIEGRVGRAIADLQNESKDVTAFLDGLETLPDAPVVAQKEAARYRVLIIEDEPIVADFYQTCLMRESFTVDVARDGRSGFERIGEWKPDLVLLDLMLPTMNGAEVLNRIRTESELADLPVIVFTSVIESHLAEVARQIGVDGIFEKANTSVTQIAQSIRTVVENKHARPVGAGGVRRDRSANPFPDGPVETGSRNLDALTDGIPAAHTTQDVTSARENIGVLIGKLQKEFAIFARTVAKDRQVEQLPMLYRRVHALTGLTGAARSKAIGETAGALELLIEEYRRQPHFLTESSKYTLARAIGNLELLVTCGGAGPAPLAEVRATALVVDDEDLCREGVTRALAMLNLLGLSVSSSAEALKVAAEQTFDLIVLDVGLPGMNGLELCREIRELPNHADTPVIFVTGWTDTESLRQTKLCGGSDYITKPYQLIELAVKALTNVMQHRMNRPTAVPGDAKDAIGNSERAADNQS